MNTQPIFTDARGRELGPRKPRAPQVRKDLTQWQKFLFSALIILGGLASTAAVTQINLATQVKGVMAVINGGTGTSSTLTGLVRGHASAMTAAELSGDVTTSGSNAATVIRVNGTTVPTTTTNDQVVVTTASATGTWKSIPNCTGALQYNTTTHEFACGSVLTGTFVDNETPSGTINGSNDTFTLADAPSPAGSLLLFKNGQLMIAGGADFTLTSDSIVFVTGAIPATGDVLRASYRF